jgi:hypothetical protein
MPTREDAQTHAGILAASAVVVSKQISVRNPPPASLPRQLRPSTLADLPRLFDDDTDDSSPTYESPMRRLGRLSSAALLYSADKKNASQPARLLRGSELGILDKIHKARQDHFKTDRSCPHCRLLFGSFYSNQNKLPPIVVVNHSARVDARFDPDTNISTAEIEDFQVIVPERVVQQMIGLSHPLHWADPVGSLFRRTEAVDVDGRQLNGPQPASEAAEKQWEALAKNEAFILEDVALPLNESLGANVENIIAIRDFKRAENFLSYDYALERCVKSNFGIAWEQSGLDVDGGVYKGRAVKLSEICSQIGSTISSQTSNGLRVKMTRRDMLEMMARLVPPGQDSQWTDQLYTGWSEPGDAYKDDKVNEAEILSTLLQVGDALDAAWPHLGPFYLLNITASKEIHFTVPENGPIELWHILTWTAPAFLFTFLNRAVCLAPHLLIDAMLNPPPKGN